MGELIPFPEQKDPVIYIVNPNSDKMLDAVLDATYIYGHCYFQVEGEPNATYMLNVEDLSPRDAA